MEKQVTIFKQVANWKDLLFYRKSDALYQLTVVFCRRFLPAHGDRTVDQMVQAARSGKQNIIEGSEDGKTSTEMELKLLNVARSSLQELREDYRDYLVSHGLPVWGGGHPRFAAMKRFCHDHNDFADYAAVAETMDDEAFANMALTLCHQTDTMMAAYLKHLETTFITEGGIKERMHSARTSYRQGQDARLKALEAENAALKAEIARLKARLGEF